MLQFSIKYCIVQDLTVLQFLQGLSNTVLLHLLYELPGQYIPCDIPQKNTHFLTELTALPPEGISLFSCIVVFFGFFFLLCEGKRGSVVYEQKPQKCSVCCCYQPILVVLFMREQTVFHSALPKPLIWLNKSPIFFFSKSAIMEISDNWSRSSTESLCEDVQRTLLGIIA